MLLYLDIVVQNYTIILILARKLYPKYNFIVKKAKNIWQIIITSLYLHQRN